LKINKKEIKKKERKEKEPWLIDKHSHSKKAADV
jgi:hypothetical protein